MNKEFLAFRISTVVIAAALAPVLLMLSFAAGVIVYHLNSENEVVFTHDYRAADHYDYEAFKSCEAGLLDQRYRCLDYVFAHMVIEPR